MLKALFHLIKGRIKNDNETHRGIVIFWNSSTKTWDFIYERKVFSYRYLETAKTVIDSLFDENMWLN